MLIFLFLLLVHTQGSCPGHTRLMLVNLGNVSPDHHPDQSGAHRVKNTNSDLQRHPGQSNGRSIGEVGDVREHLRTFRVGQAVLHGLLALPDQRSRDAELGWRAIKGPSVLDDVPAL